MIPLGPHRRLQYTKRNSKGLRLVERGQKGHFPGDRCNHEKPSNKNDVFYDFFSKTPAIHFYQGLYGEKTPTCANVSAGNRRILTSAKHTEVNWEIGKFRTLPYTGKSQIQILNRYQKNKFKQQLLRLSASFCNIYSYVTKINVQKFY